MMTLQERQGSQTPRSSRNRETAARTIGPHFVIQPLSGTWTTNTRKYAVENQGVLSLILASKITSNSCGKADVIA